MIDQHEVKKGVYYYVICSTQEETFDKMWQETYRHKLKQFTHGTLYAIEIIEESKIYILTATSLTWFRHSNFLLNGGFESGFVGCYAAILAHRGIFFFTPNRCHSSFG